MRGLTRGQKLYKKKKFCPQWNLNPVPSANEANALTIALLDLLSIENAKVYRVLPEFAIKMYLYRVVNVVKCFVVYYIFYVLQSADVLIGQTAIQILYDKTPRHIILLHLPCATCTSKFKKLS